MSFVYWDSVIVTASSRTEDCPGNKRRGEGIVVQTIGRGEVGLKFGWGVFPTGRCTDLDGAEHNSLKRLLGGLGDVLQTHIDMLG
jgi:hypothetical protein